MLTRASNDIAEFRACPAGGGLIGVGCHHSLKEDSLKLNSAVEFTQDESALTGSSNEIRLHPPCSKAGMMKGALDFS